VWLDVHDVGGGIGINHDRLAVVPLVVHFHARDCIPAREFHPGLVAKHALGVNDVHEAPIVIDGNQQNQRARQRAGDLADGRRKSPGRGGECHRHARKQDGVRPADPVQERNDSQASERSTQQIGSVKAGDRARFPGEHNRKQNPSQNERDRRGKIQHGQPQQVAPRQVQRHWNMQDDLQNNGDQDGIQAAQQGGKRPGFHFDQPASIQVGKDSARTQAEQRDRDGQEGEVIKEHNRKQTRKRQFQQERPKAAQSDAEKQSPLATGGLREGREGRELVIAMESGLKASV